MAAGLRDGGEPRVSFVVIAYNVHDSIERCLNSVLSQTLTDFEVVVVDDASDDGTSELIDKVVLSNPRCRVIHKEANAGPHLARRTGVALTSGEYVYFVDGDDEVSPHLIEALSMPSITSDVDIVRLGIDVRTEGAANEGARSMMSDMYNSAAGTVRGDDILLRAYSDPTPGSRRETWSVTACLYRGDFCRRAFEAMCDDPLRHMEDAYQFFVLASKARTLQNLTEFRAFTYHYGSGRSGRGSLPQELFRENLLETRDLVDKIVAYAKRVDSPRVRECANWFEGECAHEGYVEWSFRLSPLDQRETLPLLARCWGHERVFGLFSESLGEWVERVLAEPELTDDETLRNWIPAYRDLKREMGFDLPAMNVEEVDSLVVRYERALGELRDGEEESLRLAAERERHFSRRALNFLFPPQSKGRRILSAVLRELRG